MNALKQEGLGLLDYLVIKTGCMYLSDLSQKEMLCEIQHAVRKLDPEAFSLWEWNDACGLHNKRTGFFSWQRTGSKVSFELQRES